MKYTTAVMFIGAASAQKFLTDCGPTKDECPDTEVCVSRKTTSVNNASPLYISAISSGNYPDLKVG